MKQGAENILVIICMRCYYHEASILNASSMPKPCLQRLNCLEARALLHSTRETPAKRHKFGIHLCIM